MKIEVVHPSHTTNDKSISVRKTAFCEFHTPPGHRYCSMVASSSDEETPEYELAPSTKARLKAKGKGKAKAKFAALEKGKFTMETELDGSLSQTGQCAQTTLNGSGKRGVQNGKHPPLGPMDMDPFEVDETQLTDRQRKKLKMRRARKKILTERRNVTPVLSIPVIPSARFSIFNFSL